MKRKTTTKFIFIIIIGSLCISNQTQASYVFKAFKSTYLKGHITSSIDDVNLFDNNIIYNDKNNIVVWKKSVLYNSKSLSPSIEDHFKKYKTWAFLVIKNNEIVFEKYWNKGAKLKASNSFSMAKSITSLLMQFAIQDAYLKNENQLMIDFIPEFKNDSNAQGVMIKNLATMTSGYDWNENYFKINNPTAKAYYGDNLDKVIFALPFSSKPNQQFKYLSGTTQLLGYVIKRATQKTLAQYVSEKLWQPLGMEDTALWTVDHKGGIEKAFCCIHSNARDFAKIGQLLLQKGMWNGKMILDSHFIYKATHPYLSPAYGYSFWMDYNYAYPFYMMRGHLGQYVIIVPSENLVIVRLGADRPFKKNRNKEKILPQHIYDYITEAIWLTQ